jgi:catechol 2,3-dioxygenase-like lactoylglutathione lyase family enzyme
MTISLNHFSIRTPDIESTARFFERVVGLTDGPRPPFPFPGKWLYAGETSDYRNAVVHIIGIDRNDPAGLQQYLGDRDLASLQGSGAVDHVAFFLTGRRDKVALLERMSIPFRERAVPMLGLHQLFIEDPNGITVELNYPATEKAS